MKLNLTIILILAVGACISTSCKKFIEVDPPKNILVPTTVFASNDLATSAMLGIYSHMSAFGFGSGDNASLATYGGLSADEFVAYSESLISIYNNQLRPETSVTNSAWQQLYETIYGVNAILEGLESSNAVTPVVKSQLQGEAYFIRAFCYFYLVNLYGDVPLHLTTDYLTNAKTSRIAQNEVYAKIVSDLKLAEDLLAENYITGERVRPNKATAQALLARTYLYLNDWANAEQYASRVIERNSVYTLVSLNEVFKSNSSEAIWQLFPPLGGNTLAGAMLIPYTGSVVPVFVALNSDFAEKGFETGDQRKISWIESFAGDGETYYYPFKYQVQSSTIVTEYFMVFRLAEQFLIRAEARIRQNKLSGAIDDLDAIRSRAGLQLLKDINPGISQINLLDQIQNERRVELFTEWGDRWLNLKRTGQANAVLAPIKFNWKPEFVRYPIPFNETKLNSNIKQNAGY